MRDKFQNIEELRKSVERAQKAFDKGLDFYVKRYLDDGMTNTYDSGFRDLRFLREGSLSAVTNTIPLHYSFGTDISSIYDLYFKEFLNRYDYLVGELSKGHPKGYVYGFKGDVRSNNDSHSIYTWFCWVVCLADKDDTLENIVQHLAEPGSDALCDILLRYFGVDLSPSNVCAHPESFDLLSQSINAKDSERPLLVKTYLDEWPKRIGKLKAGSVGISCSGLGVKDIKNRDDLKTGLSDHHKGYWAWEAALVVKFFHIDDSSFKDNEYYPDELVHFRPPLDNQDFLSNLKIADDAESELELPAINPLEGDLTNFALGCDLVVIKDTDPTVQISKADYFQRDVNNNYIYRAALSSSNGEVDPDKAVLVYSVTIVDSIEDVKVVEDELLWTKSQEGWLGGVELDLSFAELFKYAAGIRYEFMNEFFLTIDCEYKDSAIAYGAQHVDGKVPPLVRLQYTKVVSDSKMLVVYCVIREDMSLTYNQVSDFWLALISRYENIV